MGPVHVAPGYRRLFDGNELVCLEELTGRRWRRSDDLALDCPAERRPDEEGRPWFRLRTAQTIVGATALRGALDLKAGTN